MSTATITLRDEIGWRGVTAEDFISRLDALGNAAEIRVLVNSPGGSVMDALAIYNRLKSHPATIVSEIEGFAASAASFAAMASDRIEFHEASVFMAHDAHGSAYGSAQDFRRQADVMDQLSATIAQIYSARTGIPASEWAAAMKEELWLSGPEAVALGLGTLIPNKAGMATPAASAHAKPRSANATAAVNRLKAARRSTLPVAVRIAHEARAARILQMQAEMM